MKPLRKIEEVVFKIGSFLKMGSYFYFFFLLISYFRKNDGFLSKFVFIFTIIIVFPLFIIESLQLLKIFGYYKNYRKLELIQTILKKIVDGIIYLAFILFLIFCNYYCLKEKSLFGILWLTPFWIIVVKGFYKKVIKPNK